VSRWATDEEPGSTVPPTESHEHDAQADDGRRWRRRVLVGGLVGLFALLLAGAAGAALFVWTESKVDRVEVQGIQPVGEPGAFAGADDPDLNLENVVNVLVVGSDAREGLTEEQRRALGTGDDDGARTDTIMLARLDPRADTVSLLSFPRDLLVTRCDGTRGRINAAFQIGEEQGIGGASCLVQTVSDFSGLPVHHYVAVDFPGFIELVDLVGGVTVYLEHEIDDWRANLHLDEGCHRLDGETALGFVRHRASDSDYGRVARQQRFVKELANEATRLGNVLNVPRLLRMIDTAADAVQTDQDLSLDLMRRIAFTFREMDADNVVARTVPGDYQVIDGVAFEVPVEAQAEELFSAFQSSRLHADAADAEPGATPSPGPAGAPAVDPADVPPVTVLNGAGVGGLASAAQAQLDAAGFRVAALGDADAFDHETTEIRHPPELAAEAETLGLQFPGAELVEDGTELVVVLGADYDPDAAPPAAPEPTPVADDAADDELAGPPPRAIEEEFVGAQPPPDHCDD
jgi:LCP family protein required for cell wall assembly